MRSLRSRRSLATGPRESIRLLSNESPARPMIFRVRRACRRDRLLATDRLSDSPGYLAESPDFDTVDLSADPQLISAARRSPDLARVEAALFLAREPLNTRRLAQLAGLDSAADVPKMLDQLNRCYDIRQNAFRVIEIAGGHQLMSRPQFAPWLRRLHNETVEVRLSSAAMETLAIVAYRQPVLRAEVESIRGVQCGEMLRQLMDRDLVRIAGRSEELGRPFLYGTTKLFLQLFGLGSINDLPNQGAL